MRRRPGDLAVVGAALGERVEQQVEEVVLHGRVAHRAVERVVGERRPGGDLLQAHGRPRRRPRSRPRSPPSVPRAASPAPLPTSSSPHPRRRRRCRSPAPPGSGRDRHRGRGCASSPWRCGRGCRGRRRVDPHGRSLQAPVRCPARGPRRGGRGGHGGGRLWSSSDRRTPLATRQPPIRGIALRPADQAPATRSKTAARPWPPPMHIVSRP